MNSHDFVRNLPDQVQSCLKYGHNALLSLWKSPIFKDTYQLLKESQWWSKDEHKEYQIRHLKKIICHAYQNVPYYTKIMDQRGLKPKDFSSTSDLQKLPFLTKELVRENLDDLMARNLRRFKFRQQTTGGSSGIPLRFYDQRGYSEYRENAFILALWERCGYRAGAKRLILRGPIINGTNRMKYNPFTRELFCSSYHTDTHHLMSYYRALKKYHIRFIHAHVSSAVTFAKFLTENRLKHKLHAVLAASEKVYPFQRQSMKEAFNTRVFSFYGHTEQVVLAGECEHSTLYHIFPEYGITELVDENDNPITRPGQTGEIVGTGFNNYAMPLIRYKTGDIASYATGSCACGRNYPLFHDVEGRSYEYILTEDSRKISLTALIFGQHFKAFQSIKKMQMYQEKKGEIEIRIAKLPGYTQYDEQEIARTILKAVESGLTISFNYPDDIPLTPAGKHVFLIQKLNFDSEQSSLQ